MSLGERIKEARKNAKLTQKELGEYCGVKDNTVSDWENNKTKPDADTVEIICKITKTEPNTLFNYVIEKKLNEIEEIKKEQLDDLSALDNVLYSKKDKIDSVKSLPIEKQQVIANAVKSVLDMIDDENSNNY